MPRKRKEVIQPTDKELEEKLVASHHEAVDHAVAEHLPADATFNPAELERAPVAGLVPVLVMQPEPGDRPVEQPRQHDEISHDEDEEKAKYKSPLPRRDWQQFADPARRHSVRFPDGYEIAVQESPSRGTVEIQFGDGSRHAQPKNFAAIRQVLRDEGMRWNGSNAWVKELIRTPRDASMAEKEDIRQENKAIRTHVEDVVFPKVIALEEQARGEIGVGDEFRQRIAKASEGKSR